MWNTQCQKDLRTTRLLAKDMKDLHDIKSMTTAILGASAANLALFFLLLGILHKQINKHDHYHKKV